MKILRSVSSEPGYYDRLVESESLSKSITPESVENSQEENKKAKLDKLSYISNVKSGGRNTFEKNITNN